MKRNASTASMIALVLMVSGSAFAQVSWVDKAGKTHVTDKMPKQEDVAPEEWARLQAEDEKKKQAEAADAESLPALNAGLFLKWKGKDGAEHHTNAPPRRSQVSDVEWERLKAEIPKLNEAATKSAAKPAEPPPAAAAEAPAGEKLPDLPSGKTIMWTGVDGKSHMSTTPPTKGQVSDKEWTRLKGAIDAMIEEAKKAPPAPAEPPAAAPPAADAPKPEGTSSKAAPEPGAAASADGGAVEVSCAGESPAPGKFDVAGKVKNTSKDQVARQVKVTVDVTADGKPVQIAAFDPVTIPVLYPGDSSDFRISFDIPADRAQGTLACAARVLSSSVSAQ